MRSDGSLKPILKPLIAVSAFLALLWAVPSSAPLAYIALAGHAARGPKESIEALTISVVLILLNPGIFPGVGNAAFLRWVILLSAFGRVSWDTFFQDAALPQHLLFPIFLFSFTVIVLSLLSSYAPVVSLFKVIAFTIGATTVLTAFHRTRHLSAYWQYWFTAVFFAISLSSLPLYGSDLGYLRNGRGFQGILNHPQSYGPFAAPMTAWFTGLLLFRGRTSLYVVVGVMLGWVAIYTSLARTAILMVGGGLLVVASLGLLRSNSWKPQIVRASTCMSTIFLVTVMIGVALFNWSSIQREVTNFILKGKPDKSIEASFENSRGFLIEQQIENFKDAPLTGIGFGVQSNPEGFADRIKRGPLGLPVGASVEKGFLPSAVLEETGIPGALIIIFVFGALMRPVWRRGSITAFWILLSSLIVNAGEMVFFSFGEKGLYFWLLIGFAQVLAQGDATRSRVNTNSVPYSRRPSMERFTKRSRTR